MSQQLEGSQHLPNPIHSALGAKIMWSCGLYVEANKLYSSSEAECSASMLRVKKYYYYCFHATNTLPQTPHRAGALCTGYASCTYDFDYATMQVCFIAQFGQSVVRADYLILRKGFIMVCQFFALQF